MLHRATGGLHIVGMANDRVTTLMRQIAGMKGLNRVVQFLQILAALAGSEDCEPSANASFVADACLFDQERITHGCQTLNSKVEESLRLSEAARIVKLREDAFSRFFRTHPAKTFPEFVNELIIGRACSQ